MSTTIAARRKTLMLMGNRSSFPLAFRLNNLSQRPPWPGPDAGRHRDQRHLTWHPLVLRSHCAGARDVAAVKSEAQQGSPKEQNRYDHVIGFRQPGRKADASENNRKERRRA